MRNKLTGEGSKEMKPYVIFFRLLFLNIKKRQNQIK